MKYNKLVRDNIPEYIRSKGAEPVIRIADYPEYGAKLLEKLQEETAELLESKSIEEIADILEVLDAICEYNGFSKTEVEKIKVQKAIEKGKFQKRIILEES